MEYLLSIVIPTYNRASTLKRALEAIANQYDKRIEVLVCDDASHDNTREVVKEIQNKVPIRYIRNEENLGFDRNFIQCYQKANGKFVLIMGDDDFLIQGGIAYILNYLEHNQDLEWIFLNVAPFEKEVTYPDTELTGKRAEIDKVHISKAEFMQYAQTDISALSSIIRRDSLQKVQNWEKYIGSYFMQTCLCIEATKSSTDTLGIIGKPCIAYHYGELNVAKDPFKFFEAFGKGLKYVFYTVGPECGYDRAQMERIFNRGLPWRSWILKWNINKVHEWRKAFWEVGVPLIKDIPSVWFKTIPFVLLPRCVAQFLYIYIRPKFQKIKNKATKKEST